MDVSEKRRGLDDSGNRKATTGRESKKKNHLYNPETTGDTPQKVCTPVCFLQPARRVFTLTGQFSYDFASSQSNVCDIWFGEDSNSLSFAWHPLFDEQTEPGWLNPPFKHSDKFLAKAADEAAFGADIVCLVQCAAGCSYWHLNDLVFGNQFARLIFLEGRIPFEGYGGNGAKTDCVIVHYSHKHKNLSPRNRILTWDWRNPTADPVPAWAY